MGLEVRIRGLCKLGVVLAASNRMPGLQRLMLKTLGYLTEHRVYRWEAQDWLSCSTILTRPRLFPPFCSANPSMWLVVFTVDAATSSKTALKAGGRGWEKWRKPGWEKNKENLSSNGSLLLSTKE